MRNDKMAHIIDHFAVALVLNTGGLDNKNNK